MAFLRAAAQAWHPADFNYSEAQAAVFAPGLLYVLRTTSLVESRADQYGDYLRAVFATRGDLWRAAIDQWNREERRHGECLRRLCEAADPAFDFARSMQSYLATTAYHSCDGLSVRGSVAGELIARCVVEALASTFYRVLHDGAVDATSRSMLLALAQDEARHYGMFRAMLLAEESRHGRVAHWRRLRVGVGRMLELSDDQIMRAAWASSGAVAGPYRHARIANRYAAALYRHYRWEHLRYAARLLTPTLFGSNARVVSVFVAAGLWLGVKLRWAMAVVASRIFSS